jgi:predicted metal-dependent phosphotriesterase family hydrolase
MNRRDFLLTSVACLGLAGERPLRAGDDRGEVITVGGSIPPEKLGVTLPHEHVLVDFIGADKVNRDRYDADEVFRVALPYLKRVEKLGCQTLVECTPAYLGRDPALLQRLARASGLHILTNTGYYGAVKGKYLPAHVHTESADQLARRWLGEWKDGIEGTGIRPGFLKIGVDAGPLTEVNRKLIRAAARTHRDSGLTIAVHTGDGTAALEELKILREEGVEGSALIWVHAQNEKDTALHARAAGQGAWVEFDGIRPATVPRHLALVKAMKENGYLRRVLLSHDAGWYHVGEKGGGMYRSYDTLFSDFLPALKEAGFTAREVKRLTVDNPREAFTVRVRARGAG